MSLRAILHLADRPPHPLPKSIRAIEDIRGVRVVRLQGKLGRDIALDADEADEQAASAHVFDRPVLFDFKDATEVDSATVAYLIRALQRRHAAHMPVGIVNAPARLAAELDITRVKPMVLVFLSEQDAMTRLAAATTSPAPPAS